MERNQTDSISKRCLCVRDLSLCRVVTVMCPGEGVDGAEQHGEGIKTRRLAEEKKTTSHYGV